MVYLLHLTVGLRRPNGTVATHYLGYCREDRLDERLAEHRSGRSRVAFLRAALARGAELLLVATWPQGGPALERYLKGRKQLSHHCDICRPDALTRAALYQRRYRLRSRNPSNAPLPSLGMGSGGDSPARSTGAPTSDSGTSPRGRSRGSTTSSGSTTGAPASGSTGSHATVEQGRTHDTGSAGTVQRSTSVN